MRVALCKSPEMGIAQPTSILLVEDYEDAREMYAEMFALTGYRVVCARDGQEALDRASAERFDVIVMDVALPKVDGIRVIQTLRSRPETKGTAIIALSATVGEQVEQAAIAAGADMFCEKPCPPDQLEADVRELLARRRPDHQR
jgi:CheY-like chemotaxis protein